VTTALSRPLFARRFRRSELLSGDAVLALAVTSLCAYAASELPVEGAAGVREPVWLSVLVGVLLGAPLAVRRLWPVAACVVILVASLSALLSGAIPDYAGAAPSAALAFALYTVGAAVPRRRSTAVLAVCLATVGLALVVVTVGRLFTGAAPDSVSGSAGVAASAGEVGFACLMMGAAWLVGWVVRERREYAARAAGQVADRAVHDERLRIARELHDIVAHSMSLIAVKAAIGNHVAEARPDEAREALRVIESTSRTALQDMRRALGVLRDDAALAPAPGLEELPALAEQAVAGGVDVNLVVSGSAVALPSGVALSVFRIVQESLTNVVKHAAPARCSAVVAVSAGEVRIEVSDDGARPVPGPVVPGHGLIGIRERVAMYGGEFFAGPAPERGFVVRVRLPYGPAE
jgi:signal transduction histidine kinase